jgi:hypothetical protein
MNEQIERTILIEQVLDAATVDEITAARIALNAWLDLHPEDTESLADGFEQPANMEEITLLQPREPATA